MATNATERLLGDKAFLQPRNSELSSQNVKLSAAERNLSVKMVRESLECIPELTVPADFSLRWYRRGDERHWFGIHAVTDVQNQITRELFQREFGTDERLLTERQCYLLDAGGNPIGTGTAWFDDDFVGTRVGRVHWVAVVPEYQGRGLAKPLMTAVCRRLSELGHKRVYLSTSTARLRAIQLYLRFGFVPLIRNEVEAAVWQELLGAHSE